MRVTVVRVAAVVVLAGMAVGAFLPWPGGDVIVKVIPLKSDIDAIRLAGDLKPLLSDYAVAVGDARTNSLIIRDSRSKIERLEHILSAMNQQERGGVSLVQLRLKYLKAPEVAARINWECRSKLHSSGGSMITPRVYADSDRQSNSIVITGPRGAMKDVRERVAQADAGVSRQFDWVRMFYPFD